MKQYASIMLLFLVQKMSAQGKYPIADSALCQYVSSNDFACQWYVWDTAGKLQGRILRFSPMQGRCREEYRAATAIVVADADTVRVILPCCFIEHEEGDMLNVHIDLPPGRYISVPTEMPWGGHKHKKWRKTKMRINEFDETVKKTVFAHIE